MNNNISIENVPFGVIIFNYKGIITATNRLAEQILRLKSKELIGKEWHNLSFRFINEEGVEWAIEKHPIIEALKAGESVKDEIIGIVHPNNNGVVWVNISVLFEEKPVGSSDIQQQIIMYLFDLTGVVKSNIISSKIVESIQLGTWEWDIQTGAAIYSDQWANMLGYTIDELQPINIDVWRRLVHPDDLKEYEELLKVHFTRNSSQCEHIVRMLHKDGHWEWVRDLGKVIQWSENGEPLYMKGIHQNISDYKKNELELSLKIEYGKILSDISSKFINTKDIDSTIIESFAKLASLNQASRIYLFWIDNEKQTMSNTHEWCNEGVSPQKDILQDLPLKQFPWWIKKLSEGETISVKDVAKMGTEAKAEKDILEEQGVKSVFVLPIIIKQLLVGFIGFDNVLSSKNWSINDIDFLSTTVSVFSYALDRKISEKELNKSYLNLRAYFDLNSDYVLILNEQGEIVEVNSVVKEKLGYQNEDIMGKNVLMLYPYKLHEKAAHIFEAMLENKKSSYTLPILTKNGKQILVQTSMTKGIWNNESVLFSINKDISEKVFSEEKFDKIFHNIPIIATLTDVATGQYIEINRVFREKLGFSFEEAIGSNPVDLLGLDADINDQVSIDLSGKGLYRDIETVIYHKNGTPIHVHLSTTSIYLLDKKYRLTLATDITENIKNQQQLLEAKTKAEESDRLKSAFLATMNHELRTPLNHIIGFSDMLPDMTEDASIIEFSKIIHKSGLNLLNIIEDIFDLAMMDQSKIKLRKESVYIRDIYLDLKKQLQETLSKTDKIKDIHLDYKINSNIVSKKIVTDKSKVMQVVTNLINNAVKFTHKGEISLELILEASDMLSILIKDTGIGIPVSKQHIIFEFFRQGDDSHTRLYDGIGIGLAISQKIAIAMGGEITLKSECGVGSEFKFTFPIRFHEEQLLGTEENITHYTTPDLSGKKILIAEDDQVGMEMIVNMISLTKCEIIQAANGYEALKMIMENPTIDLVLMDLKMPLMDGFEATKFIHQEFPFLPVIALTAYSMQQDKLKALDAGCCDILAKPVNRVMLLKKIEDLLVK